MNGLKTRVTTCLIKRCRFVLLCLVIRPYVDEARADIEEPRAAIRLF